MSESETTNANHESMGKVHLSDREMEMVEVALKGPHEGASLAHGIIEGNTVRCRIHHWRFCIRTARFSTKTDRRAAPARSPYVLLANKSRSKV